MTNKLNDFQLRYLEKEEISCQDVEALLGEYADSELTPTLRARVDNHSRTCAACAHLMDTYFLTIQLARELRDEPMPRGVQDRLRRALNERLGLTLPMVEESADS